MREGEEADGIVEAEPVSGDPSVAIGEADVASEEPGTPVATVVPIVLTIPSNVCAPLFAMPSLQV